MKICSPVCSMQSGYEVFWLADNFSVIYRSRNLYKYYFRNIFVHTILLNLLLIEQCQKTLPLVLYPNRKCIMMNMCLRIEHHDSYFHKAGISVHIMTFSFGDFSVYTSLFCLLIFQQLQLPGLVNDSQFQIQLIQFIQKRLVIQLWYDVVVCHLNECVWIVYTL